MLISNFPIYNSENYAPLKPLLELHQPVRSHQNSLISQIRALYEELERRERSFFHAIAETAYTISSFMQGKQLWQRNYFNGGKWELMPNNTGTDPNKVHGVNKMQFQISQMLEDIVSSDPDFEPADMFKSYEFEKEVKAAKAVWNNYERKFYNSRFNIQQGLSLITTGTAIEEVCYDASVKGSQVFREIWGEAEIPVSEGYGQCFECGYQGSHEDFYQWETLNDRAEYQDIGLEAVNGDREAREAMQKRPLTALAQCPGCGSFETETAEPQSETVPSIVGLERYQLGDFCLNNLPIQSVRFDVSVPPEESSYMIDMQYIPIRKIKRLFGREIKIESQNESDAGLDYLHKLARIGASIGGARIDFGSSLSKKQDSAMLIRMSLSPDEAAQIEIPARSDELETVSGIELKGGGTLADISPDGHVTILGFNGFQQIYGIYARHHTTRISSASYFSKANSGTGRAAEDLTEIQKRVNRLDAQQVAAIDGASPGYAFVEGAVDEKHIKRMGFPHAKIPVRREFFNLTKDVNNFVKQFQPQQVAPQLFAYAQELDKLMQMTAHVVSMSGTVYDADNRTATGARILEATAQAITIPIVQSKANGRKGTIRNLLLAYRENFAAVKRGFTLGMGGNKHFSHVEVAGDQLNPDIEFVVVENSMIPQNYYVRKMDYMAFTNAVQMLGGYEVLKLNDPELLKIYAKVFNVDIGADEYDQITEICRSRLSEAFELAELFEGLMRSGADAISSASSPLNDFDQESSPAPDLLLTGGADTNTIAASGQGAAAMQPDVILQVQNLFYDVVFSELTIPIMPEEKNHFLKAEWFKDFLDTQEGLKLDKSQRQVCFEFIAKHKDAERMARNAALGLESIDALVAAMPGNVMNAKVGQMAEAISTEDVK